jgi:hypothetical protein
VALVRTEVSGELSASFIRVTRISGLGTTLAVTSNRRRQRRNAHDIKKVRQATCIFRLKFEFLKPTLLGKI